MSLTTRELNQLKKIATIANQLIAKSEGKLAAAEAKVAEPAKKATKKAPVKADKKAAKQAAPKAAKTAAKAVAPKVAKKTATVAKAFSPKPLAKDGKRIRRTGDELVAFRQMLSDERKNGVSVADLSKQHGVSAAYIYQL